MDLVSTFILGALSSIAGTLALRHWKKAKHLFSPDKLLYFHLQEVESNINKMPFIYEGVEAKVMEDFVGIQTQQLNIVDLEPVGKKNEIETNERLKRSRRVLFLGGAGIGKTTFFRYTILTIIKDKSKVEFIEKEENPVPFFIPLKAVDNTVEFPIIKYILRSNSFLSTRPKDAAIKQLITLAKSQRLFLFIDGYDEIQFTGGQRGAGFIRQELNLMVASEPFPTKVFNSEDKQLKEFYESLSLCRIWLSSRKEFFEQHRIKMVSADIYKAQIVYILRLEGIGDNRMNLVGKIFDKYRSETNKFEDIFDAEFFVNEVDASPEKELRELSFNPLFLTIMCFIYAKSALKEERYDVKWSSSFNDLITKCISLLLYELDKIKIRDLPEARRAALLNRRGEFLAEKTDFLHFFAFCLFDENIKVFTLNYIIEKAVFFFEKKSLSINKERILLGFTDESIDKPHLVWQLAYTGIFVIVDKQGQELSYDFPHLRFREVLAAEYFIEHGHQYLIDNIERESLGELLYVFFNRSKSQDRILEVIFSKLKNTLDVEYYNSLLINCLRRRPPDYNSSLPIRKFFVDCLDTNSFFSVPSEILRYFHSDEDFIQILADKFRVGLEKKEIYTLSLSCYLLSLCSEELLKDLLLTNFFPQFDISDELTVAVLVKYKIASDIIQKNRTLDKEKREFFRLKDMYSAIKRSNGFVPLSDGNHVDYIYIMTDEVINKIGYLLANEGIKLTPEEQADLEIQRYKIYFRTTLLNAFPLTLKNLIADIAETAKVNFKSFSKIMKPIVDVKENETLEESFFT
ncbi:MAG TPA: NACHT domain-containing protein [Pyrinomonadaceae bacterium]|nr:NACHT domain-containing protein [Pyrinomonadaceae bacterium]